MELKAISDSMQWGKRRNNWHIYTSIVSKYIKSTKKKNYYVK